MEAFTIVVLKEIIIIYSNSISVQKVKDKIEELDEMINQISKGNLQKYTVGEIICFKKILKELLEGDD